MKKMILISTLFSTLFLAASLMPVSPVTAKVTVAECEEDYDAMVAEIENNRERSLAELNDALRLTSNDETAAAINHQIEQTWNAEETYLGHAATAYRDCVNYAKSGG